MKEYLTEPKPKRRCYSLNGKLESVQKDPNPIPGDPAKKYVSELVTQLSTKFEPVRRTYRKRLIH